MEGVSTTAVVFGGGSFVADKLEEQLKERGIKVVRGDYENIPENVAYFFDFEGREEVWERLNNNQRLVLVEVDSFEKIEEWEKKLNSRNLNWRIVAGVNVYGEGMSEEGFLGRAFLQAAKNKNLVLPGLDQIYRVLAVDDMVEAILRSCFFSGTSGKTLFVGGGEINSKIVAEVLVEEAKMTKTQVIQDPPRADTLWRASQEELEKKIIKSQELLRWGPEITFTEGAKAVIQYFVAKVDQENRKKPTIKNSKIGPQITREMVEKRYAVEVEEEEIGDETLERKFAGEESHHEVEDEEEILDPRTEILEEETGEEESREEFKLESLKKSPLPERVVEEKEVEIEPDLGESSVEEKLIPPPASLLKKEESKKIVKNKGSFWKWGLFGVGWIFLVLFLVNFIKIVTIPKKIMGTESLIEKGKYEEAKKEIELLSKNNQKLLEIFGGGKVGTLLRAEGEVVSLLGLSVELAQSGEKISSSMFGEKEIEMRGELQNVEKSLDEMVSKMGILQGRLSGQWQWLPGRYREDLNKLKDKLTKERENVERIRKILPILPEILGLDGKRREYMVLLQNENEIRASGGFIGSYAILSFEGGRWLGFEVKDVYEADGQLKGHVEPPSEIKKYLGEAGWFMRDANWQASFPSAARDIQWFLEKETGRKVDGVIGLNLASVKAILGVTGEIYVTDFKEKVNENNLYEQAEYYSETKFFAGSVQKASFLGGVSKQLMEEIKLAKGAEGQKLLTAVMDLMDRNEVQVVLNEKMASEVLAEAGWDGAIYEGKCNGEKCVADYLYIVESNLGVNKANYFLYRNIEREIEIGEKIVKNTLRITYENTAKSSAWPGGDYKNYIRIYVPVGTGVQEVNWSENGGGERKVISGEELKLSRVGNKEEIGFLVIVPVGKKIGVEVKYVENINLTTLQSFSYLNYIQRQSGFGDTGIVTLISIPENWRINAVEPAASVVGGKLLFNQKLDKDIKMGVEISR
ncbi:TPA: hypothetical protein DD455_04655 [Candidatus Shapirobacteria bacterium]|nr:hypothetical protein [Candidatus Shapirobacteria bacterium]